jgi:DNA-binding transcriptional LysR family regulator
LFTTLSLENGGAGYFPRRLVRPLLENGRLTMLAGAPEFALSAYVVYPTDADPALLGLALDSIRQVSTSEDT